ncbi:MAG: ExeM/NucH family extracellular endonuclease [Ferruginibacter sp.]|nr:ExeM/NucH family extracellular endonuclease [Cytophagales bacterium]
MSSCSTKISKSFPRQPATGPADFRVRGRARENFRPPNGICVPLVPARSFPAPFARPHSGEIIPSLTARTILFSFLWLLFFLPGIPARAQLGAGTASNVVISQVYGGGGNTGAPYQNDFVELHNRGTAPVSLAGWSVQYASATGTGNFGATSTQITELPNVTLQPGAYFLVQEAGGTVGKELPTPDFTDVTPINLSGTGGKVALVSIASSLGCNGGSAACSTASLAAVVDLVGYGSANFFEGAGATAAPSGTTAVLRKNGGATDTDDNRSDFEVATPVPRNGQPPALSVNDATVTEGNAGTTTLAFTVRLDQPAGTGGVVFTIATADQTATTADGDYDTLCVIGHIPAGSTSQTFEVTVYGDAVTEPDEGFFVNVTDVVGATVADGQGLGTIFNDDAVVYDLIHAVQGPGAASPAVNTRVSIEGIVVGDYQGTNQLEGFFVQEEDADADGDPRTSEGIFVFSTTAVDAGDKVQVAGTVTEYYGFTELTAAVVTVVGSDRDLPTPTNVSLPVGAAGDWERYEGMYVRFPQTLTVTDHYTLARYGELTLSANGYSVNPTNFVDPNDDPAGGTTTSGAGNVAAVTAQQDLNGRRRILLDDASTVQNPNPTPYLDPTANRRTIRLGTTVANLTGVLSYGFDQYRLQPLPGAGPAFVYAPRPSPPGVGAANLRVASLNVLNYFNGDGTGGGFPTARGADNAAEFNRQRTKLFEALKALNADVVGLMEVENDGVGATSAIQDLVNGLNGAVGTPGTYAFVTDPSTGVGTDTIKVAILYKPSVLTPVGASVSRPDTVFNRFPVAQTFRLNGKDAKFTVVVNHLKSKGSCPNGRGVDADQGDGQGCWNELRKRQVTALLAFIDALKASSGDDDVLAIGDFNAYEQEDPIDRLVGSGLTNLVANTYSYLFEGQVGSLDYAFATPSLAGQLTGAGKWHINSDEPTFLDYNTEFKTPPNASGTPDPYTASPFRSSDHDPILAGFNLSAPVPVGVARSPVSGSAALATHPNPFSHQATVSFTTDRTETASLVLYDPRGVRVRELYRGSAIAGQPVVVGVDGKGLAAGMYLLRLHTPTRTAGQCLVLQR